MVCLNAKFLKYACLSDHDLTVLSIMTRIPKGPGRVIDKRNYKHFFKDEIMRDLKLA